MVVRKFNLHRLSLHHSSLQLLPSRSEKRCVVIVLVD